MIVISGGNGFLGQYLLKELPNSIGVSLRTPDWRDTFDLANIVINLIGKAHDHKGVAKESDYYYANVELTKEIFKQFLNSQAQLFIHISSIAAIEEYESMIPLTEMMECNPHSWYGKTKREGELWLLNQRLPENKKLIILRPPMIHGPGDKGNLGVLYKFISKGVPYPFSSFNNSRSFISITNFNFYINEIVKNYHELDSGIYHISDGDDLSIKEIIRIIEDVSGKKASKIAIPKFAIIFLAKLGDILRLPINNKRLKKLTSTLLVSNKKINDSLKLNRMPESGIEGLFNTLNSFNTELKRKH